MESFNSNNEFHPSPSGRSGGAAIILAGGLGTRLRGVISDLPKSMAPISGKPFLHFIFQILVKQQINEVILAVGYKYEPILEYFGNEYLGIKIQYSIEDEPLGTGGAIKKAFQYVEDYAFVMNGDTLFDINLTALKNFYSESKGDLALSLKLLKNFDRYGTVETGGDNRVRRFSEKKFTKEGLINGGIYFFHKNLMQTIQSEKFSFEQEVLEKFTAEKKMYGKIFDDYFIDIGIPEDYEKAEKDFKNLFS